MDIVLFNSEDEGRFTLTNETPDGRFVVRIVNSRHYRDGDYSPEDSIGNPPYEMSLGAYVFDWAMQAIRSDAGVDAALCYLHQSPNYANFDCDDLAHARVEKENLMAAARNLFKGEKPVDQMTNDEMRAAINRWKVRLSGFVPNSDESRVLALRIKVATTLLRGD